MKHLVTLRTFVSACAALLLAGQVLATTPIDKGPVVRRPRAAPAATRMPAAVATPKATKKSTAPKPKTTTLPPTLAEVAPVAAPAASLPAAPQMTQVRGIVLNSDGRPCAGASVYPAGAPRQLVVTDAKGAFALPVSATGPVSLRVEYFGVGSSRVEVPTPTAETLHITLGE